MVDTVVQRWTADVIQIIVYRCFLKKDELRKPVGYFSPYSCVFDLNKSLKWNEGTFSSNLPKFSARKRAYARRGEESSITRDFSPLNATFLDTFWNHSGEGPLGAKKKIARAASFSYISRHVFCFFFSLWYSYGSNVQFLSAISLAGSSRRRK